MAEAHAAGRLRATLDGAERGARGGRRRAHRAGHARRGVAPGSSLDGCRGRRDRAGAARGFAVIFETTLPVGDTRGRYAPRLAEASGLTLEEDLFVAFSPERLYSGAALRNLATYPKLVGGLGPASTARAAAFYDSVLDADVVAMSSAEAAEFAKLADTTYRDVNIALANEFAGYADRIGVDIGEVIAGANSQPYSHIHQPGIGVGGHCIPVYPHFLLDRAPELELVALARQVNDGQVDVVLDAMAEALGALEGRTVLVLGLTYRHGVKELAYSRALPLIDGLRGAGRAAARLRPAADRRRDRGAPAREPWTWGDRRARRRGDRHADRRPGLAVARRGVVPGTAAVRRRPELAAGPRAARGRRLPRDRRSSPTDDQASAPPPTTPERPATDGLAPRRDAERGGATSAAPWHRSSSQDYPADRLEVRVYDGDSTDRSRADR